MKTSVIQVFEYSQLAVGDSGFTETHFNQLVRYNERHGNRYFDVGHQRIRFKNYVGVVQVGDAVIEILPKADASADPDKKRWRNALLEILRVCRLTRLESLSDAQLRLRSASLLEHYLRVYLEAVSALVRQGLVKRYRDEEDNLHVLRGRLLFRQHIHHNLVHKERFYTRFSQYDRSNIYNQILKKAMRILVDMAGPGLRVEALPVLERFDRVRDAQVTDLTFKRIRYDRNTERYREALQLAEMIILNYSPDLQAGRTSVLALLFDMNELFEKYVFRKLQQAVRQEDNISVRRQVSQVFWRSDAGNKRIRPDIMLERKLPTGSERVVLDTKWKVLKVAKPSDEDLRQMYAYHLQYAASEAVLIYPRVKELNDVTGTYSQSRWIDSNSRQRCKVQFVELFGENDRLKSDLGQGILNDVF